MKKILILLLILSINTFSEENSKNNSFFSFGLGYNGKFRFLDINDYTELLKNNDLNPSPIILPMYMHNGELMTTIGFIPNLRMGISVGYGDAYSQLSTTTFDTTTTFAYLSKADLMNFGIDISYAIPITSKLVILPNLELGIGTLNLNNYKFIENGTFDWNKLTKSLDRNYIIKDNISNLFYYAQLDVNIEYALTSFTVFRFGAGYMYGLINDWKYNDNLEIINKPSGLTANNLNLNFGIYVGVFNY